MELFATLLPNGTFDHMIETAGKIAFGPRVNMPVQNLTPSQRALFNVVVVAYVEPPPEGQYQRAVRAGAEQVNGVWQVKWVLQDWTPEEITHTVANAKAEKNEEINFARAKANTDRFTFAGKAIACDALSRSDIDGTNGFVTLYGVLPPGFPGAWKTIDGSYVMLPDTPTWKAFYAAMFAQGAANFAKSQSLKAQLAAAADLNAIAAIQW